MSTMEDWNRAWDQHVLRLVPLPKHFKRHALEGACEFDRKVVLQCIHKSCVRTQKDYDRLLCEVSELGYCVETPATFEFIG